MAHEFHLSDRELLMAMDGELPGNDKARVNHHLAACWTCRGRRQDLERSISEFIRFHHSSFKNQVPSADGPTALLRAQLQQMATENHSRTVRFPFFGQRRILASLLTGLLVFCVSALTWHQLFERHTSQSASVILPNPSLTPGATVVLGQPDVCREASVSNKNVPLALQKAVFAEYGISGDRPEAYEVDYLITPALGGADDIHNLWPESNQATRWNSKVKDALEDHLRFLVCQGQVDLQTAQHEISTNWIEAYKKYFHTDRPLASDR